MRITDGSICDDCVHFEHECGVPCGDDDCICYEYCKSPNSNIRENFHNQADVIKECATFKKWQL
jgi:hypothetical protein